MMNMQIRVEKLLVQLNVLLLVVQSKFNSLKLEIYLFICIWGPTRLCIVTTIIFIINDIQHPILKSNIKIQLLADDTGLFLYHSNSNKLFAMANDCIKQLSEWFTVNKLHLHPDNNCYSMFGPKHKNLDKFKLYIWGKEIKQVTYCKYVAILIDTDLKWQEHINYIYIKLIKYYRIFYKISDFIKSEQKFHKRYSKWFILPLSTLRFYMVLKFMLFQLILLNFSTQYWIIQNIFNVTRTFIT